MRIGGAHRYPTGRRQPGGVQPQFHCSLLTKRFGQAPATLPRNSMRQPSECLQFVVDWLRLRQRRQLLSEEIEHFAIFPPTKCRSRNPGRFRPGKKFGLSTALSYFLLSSFFLFFVVVEPCGSNPQ